MTDQEAREFLQRLAVPERSLPPECPLCQGRHALEQRCAGRGSGRTSARPMRALGAAAYR